MKPDKIFRTMFGIFVVCFPFCLPSSSAATATADDDGKQKRSSSSSSSSSTSSSSSSSDHVAIEINPRPPINNSRLLAMITGINLMFQQHDIGKTTMGYVPAMLVVLLINRALFPTMVLNFVVIAFALGFVIIWNGILLRDQFQRFSCVAEAAEQVGVVVVFMGFFGLIAAVLPLSLVWAPVLCAVLFLLPFLISCITATLPTGELAATGSTQVRAEKPNHDQVSHLGGIVVD